MVSKLAISGVAGHSEVHLSKVISLLPTFLHAFTANSISLRFAIPVEIIIGFPLLAAYSIKGMSLISGEAILYIGVSISSKKSTAFSSNGDDKKINPLSSVYFFNFGCHS